MTRRIEIKCERLLSMISSYLDGELPESACAAIERHAASCPGCGRVIDDLRTTTGLCRTAARSPLPEEVRALARRRVRELLSRK